MKRDNIDLSVTPPDLHEAEALLIRYGLWAQDRYKKRRCASAEGRLRGNGCAAGFAGCPQAVQPGSGSGVYPQGRE